MIKVCTCVVKCCYRFVGLLIRIAGDHVFVLRASHEQVIWPNFVYSTSRRLVLRYAIAFGFRYSTRLINPDMSCVAHNIRKGPARSNISSDMQGSITNHRNVVGRFLET